MGFKVKSEEEYAQSDNDSFGLLAEDEYRVKVINAKSVNRISQYNPNGDRTWDIILQPLSYADDEEAPLVDSKGEPLHPDKHLVFFFDANRMGLKPVISKNRKFLSAALNIPITDGVDAGSEEELIDMFESKELIVGVIIKEGRNKVTDVRPIRKKGRRPVAVKTLVEEAEEAFGTPPEEPLEF